ncbi:hypothetical protein, partial [Thiolapillus sp.]|uniref:hypothetical protein n=1 Tax=Thiolapillus sp. TaxID=2017437 RepID=UPI003AF664C8
MRTTGKHAASRLLRTTSPHFALHGWQRRMQIPRRTPAWQLQACRYLVIDFGTSKSPKSTRQRDNHYCPGRPASVPLRHTFVNSALATQHSLK